MAEQTGQKTAVEWLNNNMPNVGHYIPMGVALELHAKFQQAERIHEMQIKDAYDQGQNNGYNYRGTGKGFISDELYYEQTYTQSGTQQD